MVYRSITKDQDAVIHVHQKGEELAKEKKVAGTCNRIVGKAFLTVHLMTALY